MRQMKDSGIEWIGKIPQDWDIERIQWHLEEVNEINNPIQTTYILSLNNKVGVIPYDDRDNMGNKAKDDYSQYKLAYPDTLVMNSMNVIIGSVGISKYFGCVSPVYYVFKHNENTDLRYINYIFQCEKFQKELRKYANGILEIRLRISVHDTLRRCMPCPNLSEQKRIADYLDEKCTEIDNAISKTTASIEEYKKLKQSIITKAVTKGIRGNRPMKDSGIEWIGEIPADWKIEKLKYVSMFSPPCDKTGISVDTVITYLPMECVKNGSYVKNTKEFGKLSTSLTEFQDGDIIMAKVTPCFENGNIAILEGIESGYGVGSSELFVYRPTRIVGKFLFYWLRNDYFMDIGRSTMTGTGGLKRVNPYFARNCEIHYPPEIEQREIAAYLDGKCYELDNIITKKQQLITELEAYKKSLIYEYVTGKKEVL